MTNDEIKAVQERDGIHMVVRRHGETQAQTAKSIEPGKGPPEGAWIVAVKGVATVAAAREEIKLAQRVESLSEDELDEIEENDPQYAGKLRRARRRVRLVGVDQ